jgi:hypothetical protein
MKARYRHGRRADGHYPRSGGARAAAVAAADGTFPAVPLGVDGYPDPDPDDRLTWDRTRLGLIALVTGYSACIFQLVAQTARGPSRPLYLGDMANSNARFFGAEALARVCAG